jgi:hypothetical protein
MTVDGVYWCVVSLIRGTARGKMWAALSGTFCIGNSDGNAAHTLLRAALRYILVW